MRRLLPLALLALALSFDGAAPAPEQRFDGFNVIATPGHAYGSPSARAALAAARRAGANAIAIVPFFWQRNPQHAEIVRGDDMADADLRLAIREAHALGLKVLIKPQVWVDGSWAGAVELRSEEAWQRWFEGYRTALVRIARIAAEENAEALVVGTELKLTTQRPEWLEMIAAVRNVYSGMLTYAAHNVEEAEAVPFWGALDAIGVTLYPPLGDDRDRVGRLTVMAAVADRLDAFALRIGRPVIVAEIGLRSAQGAAAKPWESAEERQAEPDLPLQADVLAEWLAALDRPAIRGVLIWRWFTDPSAGGPNDTDFTVQNKPAERRLGCAWTESCQD